MWSAKNNSEFEKSLASISHSIQEEKNANDRGMIQMVCDANKKTISIISRNRNMKIKSVVDAKNTSESFNVFFLYDYFKEIVSAFAEEDDLFFDFVKDKGLVMKSSSGEYSIGAVELDNMIIPSDLLYNEVVPSDVQSINGVVFYDNISDCSGFISNDDSAHYEAMSDVRVVCGEDLSFFGTDSKTIVRKVDVGSKILGVNDFTCSTYFINALSGGVTPNDKIGFIEDRIVYYRYSNVEIWSRINKGDYPPVDSVLDSNDFLYYFEVDTSELARIVRSVGVIADKTPLLFSIVSGVQDIKDSISISCNNDDGSSNMSLEVSKVELDYEDGLSFSDVEFYIYKDKLYPALNMVSTDMCRVCLHRNRKMLKLFSISSEDSTVVDSIDIVTALANSPVAKAN